MISLQYNYPSGPEGMLTLANQNEIYNTIANQAAIAADMYIVGIPVRRIYIIRKFSYYQELHLELQE